MSNSFSSLENINIFINDLINSNQDALPLKYISQLVNDLSKLLNESDSYDVEIKVGAEQDVKTFKAHSNILKARSTYFKSALSANQNKKSDCGIILFEKENISPKVFEVFLKYIYNGIVSVDELNPNEILGLLEACDELELNELIDDLQNYLITNNQEWIQQNLIYVHKISLKHQLFSMLQDCCNKLIRENPELIFKSNDFKDIDKSTFITILKKDEMELDEISIWDYVIKWGIGQKQELEKNISDWNKDDFKQLKNILADIIPLIRFNQISPDDFYEKIKPYKKSIDKELYEEILQYYITSKWQPRLLLPKGPRTKTRKTITITRTPSQNEVLGNFFAALQKAKSSSS